MSRSRRSAMLALGCLCLLAGSPASGLATGVLVPCAPLIQATRSLPIRVDSLLALDASGAALALVGPQLGGARYLPHDDLVLLTGDGAPAWRLRLPRYVTPPGIAVPVGDPATAYVVVDHVILLVDRHSGAVRSRVGLDMQALGWPAAVTAAPGRRLYIVGQPDAGWAAVAEALIVSSVGTARVVWRARLGLFHAGIWLGPMSRTALATYLPGAYDRAGMVAVLDGRTGATRGSYAVPAPPIAVDPAAGRLYVEDGRAIHALPLRNGRAATTATGHTPFALAAARGIVAFVQGDGITVATASTLQRLGHLTLPGVTALAMMPDGATLLAGWRDGITRIALSGCRAA